MFESSKILHENKELIVDSIAHAYETGALEDPNYAVMFTSLLALLCEGKVQGTFKGNIITGPVWKLTPEYEEQLLKEKEALAAKNVVIGPW